MGPDPFRIQGELLFEDDPARTNWVSAWAACPSRRSQRPSSYRSRPRSTSFREW